MQCGEVIYHSYNTMTKGSSNQSRPEKESIHSGHFMISHFEAEAQDDEDDLALPLPDESEARVVFGQTVSGSSAVARLGAKKEEIQQQISIETSLNKLFKCMTLAYRQKLTSPKWNRFKGIKLRWKDKIRLNNVIWRCWHMQFILKQNTLVCQFASPLDVDTHIKPEATILEGKYWKRRSEAVIAEYKKWRMYYKNKTLGWGIKDVSDVISDMDVLDWQSQGDNSHMLVDEDYIAFMSDTLFSTITSNQPFAFPDTREIARGASLADFIQPSLGPLQPNLEDFMDTLEPLQELLSGSKLPPVPEELSEDNLYKNIIPPSFMDQNLQQALVSQNTQYQNTSLHQSHMSQSTHISPHITQTNTNNHNLMLQGSMPSDPTLNQNPCLNTSTQNNTGIMMTQSYLPQGLNQLNNQSSNDNLMRQHPMLFDVQQTNIVSHQQNMNVGPLVQTQHNVIMSVPSNNQMQKQHTPYIQQQQQHQQNPKPFQQMTVGYQDRNFPTRQGMQQSPNESDVQMNRVRTYSAGSLGYSADRRSLPIAPAPPTGYTQPRGTPPTTHNTRFKMPSPPPQIAVNTQIRGQQNMQQLKQKPIKQENFRSNSLPIGATLASVMGLSSGAMGVKGECSGSGRSRGRRPRSGSSSPAPTQRRGPNTPAPLLATASEPVLKDSSVLLAQLLTSKGGQNLFKPSSVQAIPSEMQSAIQPHPVALVTHLPTTIVSSAKLISLGNNSPTGLPSPQSPLSPGSGGEHRRVGHIHAEQKRRYNIKNGFDVLQSLIPQLSQNPKSKVSKAAMLQKAAEYIKQLQTERSIMKEDMDGLRQHIDMLNNSLSNCQSLLPATGVTVSRQRSGRLKEMFDHYVRERTNENWKFWIFSLLIEPLLESFNNSVSPLSRDELKRSTYLWAEQHCSLVEMRPAVLNSLKSLSITTDILQHPERLPEEALAAVQKARKNSLGGSSRK